jgi:hypothetical protein
MMVITLKYHKVYDVKATFMGRECLIPLNDEKSM